METYYGDIWNMSECNASETGEHQYEAERDEFMNKHYSCVLCGQSLE